MQNRSKTSAGPHRYRHRWGYLILSLGLIPALILGGLPGCMKAERLGTDTNSPNGLLLVALGLGYTVGGTITNLSGEGLVLQMNGGSELTVPAGSTTFAFPARVADGTAFDVRASARPSGTYCAVYGGTGTIAGANANVRIECHATGADTAQQIGRPGGYIWLEGGFPALQSDGGLLMVGLCRGPGSVACIARLDPSRALDRSFGAAATPGFVILPSNEPGQPGLTVGQFWRVSVQPDGRILVLGSVETEDRATNYLMLTRLQADGSLDPSFGGGDGIVLRDLQASSVYALALALQGDGRILVAAQVFDGSGYGPFRMLRFLADGTVDSGFANGSMFQPTLGGASPAALAVQQDGRILVGGSILNSSQFDLYSAVIRFDSTGVLDPSFGGGDGVAVLPASCGVCSALALALTPDGRVVAVGRNDTGAVFARFTADGLVDATYNGGQSRIVADAGEFVAVVVQPDGRIMAGGTSSNDFFLAQTLADGTADGAFGNQGLLTRDITGTDSLSGLVQQPDGAILATGHANNSGGSSGDFAVLKLWP